MNAGRRSSGSAGFDSRCGEANPRGDGDGDRGSTPRPSLHQSRSDEQAETLARWIERHECGSLNRPASEVAAR